MSSTRIRPKRASWRSFARLNLMIDTLGLFGIGAMLGNVFILSVVGSQWGCNRPPWRLFLWRMRIVTGKKLAMTARLGAICPGMRSDHNIRATRAGRTAQVWLWREQIAPLWSINCRIGEHD